MLPWYRNQSIDLYSKSVDWFPYEGNTGNKATLVKYYIRETFDKYKPA